MPRFPYQVWCTVADGAPRGLCRMEVSTPPVVGDVGAMVLLEAVHEGGPLTSSVGETSAHSRGVDGALRTTAVARYGKAHKNACGASIGGAAPPGPPPPAVTSGALPLGVAAVRVHSTLHRKTVSPVLHLCFGYGGGGPRMPIPTSQPTPLPSPPRIPPQPCIPSTHAPQYLEKLELVAQILNRLDHAWYVRAFFKLPIKPRRGLPSTPRSDTAVTLRLNTSPTWQYVKTETVREYFP